MTDAGRTPYLIDIEQATVENTNFRTALWTGDHLQLTAMSIEPGDDIGLESHSNLDQFLRIESGVARVQMGPTEDQLDLDEEVGEDWAILVPAGFWHNLINVGSAPLKIYSIYSPPEHAHGIVHATKADDEHHHHH